MRLFVRHRSEYVFSEPQARLVQLLRLTPLDHVGQSIVSWGIDVDHDARLKQAYDGYGNRTTMLYIDGPLDRITIEAHGEVLVEDRAGVVAGTREPLPSLYFLQQTDATKPGTALVDFARSIAGSGPLERAHNLAGAVGDRLAQREANMARDHAAAACFEACEADPQGAAHVLIAASRAIGLPARYVAGHLNRAHAEEGHAAYGWAEIHVEDYGWIGFDAHVGRCPTADYVRVAVGLDHREAAPLSGLRTGGGHERLSVDVHVGREPLPA